MVAAVTYVPQEQIQRFRELQDLPYRLKIPYAIGKAQEFYDTMEGKVFCSVGGLDSITLLLPILLQIPAAKRFVSVEPMLGPVDLNQLIVPGYNPMEYRVSALYEQHDDCLYDSPAQLDWVTCGGETGPGDSPMHPDWARSLRDQCQAAGTSFLFKSWGDWAPINQPWNQSNDIQALSNNERWLNLAGGHGFHGENVWRMRKVGKKAAGRLLDGREWNEYPGVRV